MIGGSVDMAALKEEHEQMATDWTLGICHEPDDPLPIKAGALGYIKATRQITGTPRVHHAYVYDRATGKVLAACSHKHRSQRAALACASRLIRAVICEAINPDRVGGE